MTTAAMIIVAAGRGTRLGAPDKVLLPLSGRPVLSYSIDAAESATSIVETIVVAGMHTKARVERLIEQGSWTKVRHVALGGERRQDSVEAGLRLVRPDVDIVVIHDGARPMVTARLIEECVAAAARSGAAIAAVPIVDTLKRVSSGFVESTVSRDSLWAAQTPQAVQAGLLRDAFVRAHAQHLEVTDEAGLMESIGQRVEVVLGSVNNLKITRPEDTDFAEALMQVEARRTRR